MVAYTWTKMLTRRGESVLLGSDARPGPVDGQIDSILGDSSTWHYVVVPSASLPNLTWLSWLLDLVPVSRLPMWEFYESQLAILVFFSIFFYALDKKFSRKPDPKERSDHPENDRLGHSDNASTLARKYLTVYAIVMGKIVNLIDNLTYLIAIPRRGLAPRPIRVLLVQRRVCIPGANGRLAFCDWLHVRCPHSSAGWSLG